MRVHKMSHMPNSNHIVYFFLDLYRRQVGLPEPDPHAMSAYPLKSPADTRDVAYELKVSHEGRTHTRRMSLCRLGDDVESRSTCYKVIYDDLLVLKVPPEPVTDFDQYLKRIEIENTIAKRLAAEVPCISPSLSAVLRRYPEFRNDTVSDPAAYEEETAGRLKRSPELQRYLKIRGTFVFFLELSTYLFFSQILERVHRHEGRLKEAITGSCDTMDNIVAFEEAFGKDSKSLFFSFSNLQNTYVAATDQLLQKYGLDTSYIDDQRKKQWMFDQIAGRKVSVGRRQLPPGFLNEQQQTGRRILSAQKKDVVKFVDLLKSDIQKAHETRNRQIASGLVSHIVLLLYRLRKKETAVRDMKPDNMFLAGESRNPDLLVSSPHAYKLGLIDLETSIHIDSGCPTQPLLAGTPFFATPSHLFENPILQSVLNDMPRTFYLQDGFAAIGIIYSVITGKTLFEKTAKLIPEMARLRMKALLEEAPMEEVFRHVSWVFWQTASAEFRDAMKSNRRLLEQIPLSLRSEERQMLLGELIVCERLLDAQIEASISSQSFFVGEKAHQGIYSANAQQIEDMASKWETGHEWSQTSSEDRRRIADFFRRVGHLKECREILLHSRHAIETKTPEITAWQLMLLLFRVVFIFMYRPGWTYRRHPEPL